MKTALENAKGQLGSEGSPSPAPAVSTASPSASTPNLEEMMRNMNMGGGGMPPELQGMMNNPMMRQMAESMMASGGMERLMQNPAVGNMMNRINSGGGMPSMAELMSDPSLREMAQNLMGGLGGGRGSG